MEDEKLTAGDILKLTEANKIMSDLIDKMFTLLLL